MSSATASFRGIHQSIAMHRAIPQQLVFPQQLTSRRSTVCKATAGPQALGHAQRYLLKAADKSAVAIMFGIAYAAATVLSVQADPSLEIGKDVFENNCAACHAGGGNVVDAGKTLEKTAIERYLDGGLNISAIVYQVQNGKNSMPAWSGRLDEEEIQSVAEYVYDQATTSKW